MPAFSFAEDLEFAGRLADAARKAILPHFRSGLSAENKLSDGFDPVTIADRASEQAMRDLIERHRPDDGIIGEEFGVKESANGRSWTLDPIDGTRGFISGTPTWAVLIALAIDGEPVAGVIDQPFTGERCQGAGDKAKWVRGGDVKALKTSRVSTLEKATLFTTDTYLFEGSESAAFERVRQTARLTRYGMDAYAYGLLAAGEIELVIESGLAIYDVHALIPVVRGAGGIITAWDGSSAAKGGRVIAAANRRIYDQARSLLNQA